jgi:alkyldihydroxyacetonephosphate synthase
LREVEGHFERLSLEEKDRLHHAHGHTCDDIWRLRYGKFARVPDAVIWPGRHEHVEVIVKAATLHNVVIIPYGGGTSVSSAIECPEHETRMIVSLDMHEMNRIKWIDYESMMACIECGIIGKDLDSKLAKLGLCMGHEPDSNEFSSLGGWIATRASGMKKNVYGNIEDILVSAKMVTPIGTVEKENNWPRVSTGPDVHQIMLGSEGTLGVITEATVRLRALPEVQAYGSIVFPDFECGLGFMREIARQRCAPASIRLMDNIQFQFGQVLKPEDNSLTGEWIDAAKKWYVTSYKGFDVNKMVAVTLLFEGSAQDVAIQQKKVYAISAKFNGLKGGEENGRRGYFLTYMIAYIRDFSFQYSFMAESFETSVPWSNVGELCYKVKDRIRRSCTEKGVKYPPFITCRVTQTYDTGACIYFYFGFIYRGLEDPLKAYIEIETEARDEILKLGGSLSHHHGIGKLRKQWMNQTVSPTGVQMLKGVKTVLDPKNIFGNGNLIP